MANQSFLDLPDLFPFWRPRPNQAKQTQKILIDGEIVDLVDDIDSSPEPIPRPVSIPIEAFPKSSATTRNGEEQDPSNCSTEYWLYARNDTNKNNATGNILDGGKWLIFESPWNTYGKWKLVKKATEEGKLGFASEVSTMINMQSQLGRKSKQSVICIYTPDWKDQADCMRVREALRELGFNTPLSYKSTEDSLAKKSWETGHKHFSKYYC